MREAPVSSKRGSETLAGGPLTRDTLYNHISPPNWAGMDGSLDMPVADPGAISGEPLRPGARIETAST